MSVTDELIRLLDERGIEYTVIPEDMYGSREYIKIEGVEIRTNGLSEVAVFFLTPEQAVEAALGMGTCKNLITQVKGQMPMLHCDECGCTTTLNVPSGGAGYIGETEMEYPLYCANCGRKVRS